MDYYLTITYNIHWLGDISTRKERHGNTITRLGRLQQTERVGGKRRSRPKSDEEKINQMGKTWSGIQVMAQDQLIYVKRLN